MYTTIMEKETLTLKFDGQEHQVNIQTFVYSVLNFSEVIKEVYRTKTDGKIEISIKAPERGSLLVDIVTTSALLTPLIPLAIPLIKDTVETVKNLYELHKAIGGKNIVEKNERDNTIEIKTGDNSTINVHKNVYNTYIQAPVQNALTQNFAALTEDPAVSRFEIFNNGKSLVSVEQKDYDRLSIKSVQDLEGKKLQTVSATLYIYKLILDKNDRKWEFFYNGNKIQANIKDDSFFKRIDQGERFGKGDQLMVDLQITQIFDTTVNTYVNESYQVIKVGEHVEFKKPVPLPFE